MKGLTICQPYAHLIVTPQEELPVGVEAKMVENRTWPTSYRGRLLIHAGKSEKYLRLGDQELFPSMEFGAVVGVATLCACVQKPLGGWQGRTVQERWLQNHVHAEGSWCWVLKDMQRLTPIPWAGAQGLWNVNASLEEAVCDQLLPANQ